MKRSFSKGLDALTPKLEYDQFGIGLRKENARLRLENAALSKRIMRLSRRAEKLHLAVRSIRCALQTCGAWLKPTAFLSIRGEK